MKETTGSYQRAQLATLSGVKAETLRFYEKSGLLAPSRTANGYRSYNDEDLKRLKFIRRALAAGFSLDQIKPLLAGQPEAISHALAHIEALSNDLEKLSKSLKSVGKALTSPHQPEVSP